MPAFQHANIMTDSASISNDMLMRTVVGMAHFAGSGPAGETCGKCDFWVQCRKKMICGKYQAMTGDDRKGIPVATSACRYFVKRNG